jgi:hypothetical protein
MTKLIVIFDILRMSLRTEYSYGDSSSEIPDVWTLYQPLSKWFDFEHGL